MFLVCVWLLPSSESDDGQEDVDDVHVDLSGGQDVFLGGDGMFLPSHDHLGVVNEESGKDHGDETAPN